MQYTPAVSIIIPPVGSMELGVMNKKSILCGVKLIDTCVMLVEIWVSKINTSLHSIQTDPNQSLEKSENPHLCSWVFIWVLSSIYQIRPPKHQIEWGFVLESSIGVLNFIIWSSIRSLKEEFGSDFGMFFNLGKNTWRTLEFFIWVLSQLIKLGHKNTKLSEGLDWNHQLE